MCFDCGLNAKFGHGVEGRNLALGLGGFVGCLGALPAALQERLALRFLGCEDGLPLNLGLARDLGETVGLGLARCLGGFRSQTRGKLRLFLTDAFGFFFLAEAFGCRGLFSTQPGFFPGLGTGSRKITILGSVEIRPGIECGYILGSVVWFGQRLRSHRIRFGHTHLQLSAATLRQPVTCCLVALCESNHQGM
jgi:hypothetical protein